jgi:hypothetical protein
MLLASLAGVGRAQPSSGRRGPRADLGAAARRGVDLDRPADLLDPAADRAGQADAFRRRDRVEAAAVVADRAEEPVVGRFDVDDDPGRLGVLAGVGQRLADGAGEASIRRRSRSGRSSGTSTSCGRRR